MGHPMKMSASYMAMANFSQYTRLLLLRLHPVLYSSRNSTNLSVMGENLPKVLTTVSTLPVSTAEFEQGFSPMNHILTYGRNRMNVYTLNSLLFISVNGPGVVSFPVQKFVEMWVKDD